MKQKEPGQYMGSGIGIGVAIGIAIGAAMDNIALGIALGTAIGAGIGSSLEQNACKKGEIRTLTPEETEKHNRMRWIVFAAGFLLAVVIAYLVMSV